MKEYVLDANALVRLYRNAPGADTVDDLVMQAKSGRAHLSISVLNMTEVIYVLARYFGQEKALLCIDATCRVVEPISADEQIAIIRRFCEFDISLDWQIVLLRSWRCAREPRSLPPTRSLPNWANN